MSSVTLLCRGEELRVSGLTLINTCSLFKNNLALAASPYAVRSPVSAAVLRQFAHALEGRAVEVAPSTFYELSLLSAEFGFDGLHEQLARFAGSGALADPDALARIGALEEEALRRDREIAALQCEIAALRRGAGAAQPAAAPDAAQRAAAPDAERAPSLIAPELPAALADLRAPPRAAVARQPRRIRRASSTRAATGARRR
jgi:hypothetical protein